MSKFSPEVVRMFKTLVSEQKVEEDKFDLSETLPEAENITSVPPVAMKTVKQIADELGVSKQAVHQKRKSKALSTALQSFTSTVDGIIYISVDGEKLIKSAFSETDRKHIDGSFTSTVDGSFTPVDDKYDVLIAMLQKELDAKNSQLAVKDNQLAEKDNQLDKKDIQISELTAALVAAQQSIKAAQALHAGEVGKLLVDGQADPRSGNSAAGSPPGVFGRIFGRKK